MPQTYRAVLGLDRLRECSECTVEIGLTVRRDRYGHDGKDPFEGRRTHRMSLFSVVDLSIVVSSSEASDSPGERRSREATNRNVRKRVVTISAVDLQRAGCIAKGRNTQRQCRVAHASSVVAGAILICRPPTASEMDG